MSQSNCVIVVMAFDRPNNGKLELAFDAVEFDEEERAMNAPRNLAESMLEYSFCPGRQIKISHEWAVDSTLSVRRSARCGMTPLFFSSKYAGRVWPLLRCLTGLRQVPQTFNGALLRMGRFRFASLAADE